jgi:hypothetical protein
MKTIKYEDFECGSVVKIVVHYRLPLQTENILVMQCHNFHIDEIIWNLMGITEKKCEHMQIFPDILLLHISVELLNSCFQL